MTRSTGVVTICSVGLLGAVQSLREGLRSLGSELIIRGGATHKMVPEFAHQVDARGIIIEDEVEHR